MRPCQTFSVNTYIAFYSSSTLNTRYIDFLNANYTRPDKVVAYPNQIVLVETLSAETHQSIHGTTYNLLVFVLQAIVR